MMTFQLLLYQKSTLIKLFMLHIFSQCQVSICTDESSIIEQHFVLRDKAAGTLSKTI